jgi:hypothetical protein
MWARTSLLFKLAVVSGGLIHSSYASLPKLYALHINGMDTTFEEASENLKHLKTKSKLTSTNDYLNWGVVYNPTRSEGRAPGTYKWAWNLSRNVWDVLFQKFIQEPAAQVSLDVYSQFYLYIAKLFYAVDSNEYALIKSYLQEAYGRFLINSGGSNSESILANFHQQVPAQFKAVVNLLRPANSQLSSDYYLNPHAVLLIPHSQGSLYANWLIAYLTQVENFNPKHIAAVAIATPAEDNRGDWPVSDENEVAEELKTALLPVDSYLTSCDDMVIGTLTKVITSGVVYYNELINYFAGLKVLPVLACNNRMATLPATWSNLGHNLISYYLADNQLSSQIAKLLNYNAYILNWYQFRDWLSVMVANKANQAPESFEATSSLIVGFTRDTSQLVLNSAGMVICANDQCLPKVSRLLTPVLDNYVEAGTTRLSNFPPRLIHYALVPTTSVTPPTARVTQRYLIVEPSDKLTDQHWPYLIYPGQNVVALGVTAAKQADKLIACNYRYRGYTSEFGDRYTGVYKILYASDPFRDAFYECSTRFPELWHGKLLIDAIYELTVDGEL